MAIKYHTISDSKTVTNNFNWVIIQYDKKTGKRVKMHSGDTEDGYNKSLHASKARISKEAYTYEVFIIKNNKRI